MLPAFAGKFELANQVQNVLGSGVSRDLTDALAAQLWKHGVRSMDDLCVCEEFFELVRRLDAHQLSGGGPPLCACLKRKLRS